MTPAKAEAARFTPTASISMPRADRRISSATATAVSPQSSAGAGIPSRSPEPKKAIPSWEKVRIRPSVTSCAIPRPEVIRISVATMGWMPMIATSVPFHSPASTPARSASASAPPRPYPWVIDQAATAPVIAMVVPTLRSMPRVAMTRVMPTASRPTGAPRFKISMIGPTRRPFTTSIRRKSGKNSVTSATSAARVSNCGVTRRRAVMLDPPPGRGPAPRWHGRWCRW